MEVIETIKPKEDAAKALGALLNENKDKPILLMLSGGSAFTILEFVPSDVLGPHITVTVLDERYSIDPQVNNFAQLEQTSFYKVCLEQEVSYISTKVQDGETLDGLRDRFDVLLHSWKEHNRDGVVIATMGIGPDGHTAGIFPGEHGVDFNGDSWVVGYSVPNEVNEYTNRVTVTNTFLREQVDAVVVYAVGNDKYRLVQEIKSDSFLIHEIPAIIIKDMPASTVFTDLG